MNPFNFITIWFFTDCYVGFEQPGPTCRANFPVYYYDYTVASCVPARYGGCKKTNNNFKSQQECALTAESVCKSSTYDSYYSTLAYGDLGYSAPGYSPPQYSASGYSSRKYGAPAYKIWLLDPYVTY